MIAVAYTPKFVRQFKKLNPLLQKEIIKRVFLFATSPLNPALRVHKLQGELSDNWSFSVNYKYRIIFKSLSETEVIMVSIGDHDIYKK